MTRSRLIPKDWTVPQEFHNRLGDRAGRQRVMFAEGVLLFVLHAPPEPDQPTRTPRLFLRQAEGTWLSPGTPEGLQAFRNHLNELMATIEVLDLKEDRAATAAEYFSILHSLAPLKRSTENLLHVLEEARKLLPSDRDIIILRDQAYDVARTAELLYSATRNGMDMAQTRRAEEQAAAGAEMAAAAHRLNQLVAFFFPLATLTAVFGMQLASGLERYPEPWPFVVICAIGLLAGFIFLALVRR